MIQGLDPLGASPLRHEAIYLEGRGAIAQPEQARQLALPATQVVQASDAAVEGQLHTGLPGSVAAQASARPVEPPRYTLGQAFAAAQAMALSAPGSPAGASEVMRLMQQAPSWGELLRLLQALTQSGTLNGSGDAAGLAGGGSPGWAGILGSLLGASFAQAVWPLRGDRLPRMGGLSGESLKQAMSGGGWATEALLMAGTSGLDHDIKVMMRRILRGLQGQGGAAGEALQSVLQRGVDDLERGQLETLTAQMQGQLLLQFVIPFGDGGPVALRIFRDRAREEEPDPEFVVDMHSRHSGLGPIWLRTAIQPAQRVALAMWAESAAVARLAREHANELRLTLAQQGLRLMAFDIHQGPRPVQEDVFLSQAPREAAA